MKLQINKKYLTISAYVCVCAAIILFLYFMGDNADFISGVIKKFNRIMSPVYYGLIFAYIANPLLNFFEKRIFKFKKKERKILKRTLSLLLTYIVILSVVAAFFMLLLPQVIASYQDLYSKLEILFNNLITNLDSTLSLPETFMATFPDLYDIYTRLDGVIDFSKISDNLEAAVNQLYSMLQSIVPNLLNYISAFFIGFKNVFIGLIFSVYFLASKEKLTAQIRKILRSLLSDKAFVEFYDFAHDTDKKFGSFIIGKILDSLIIGFITLVVLGLIGMPYYPLISVIVCITNVIPFIGPFIGAIPCAFIVLTVSPWYCLIFVIFIIILQQIDGNYIGPKILGEAIGISSLWILFAITVMGGYFGLVGMLIGAPTFAVIYSLIKRLVEKRLSKKSLPIETTKYYNADVAVITGNNSDSTTTLTEKNK
ncbi:MAG: AI-2E family transporter [Ruminococcaceae bacterium]|nr:AI-2E family transporter [Oscillospiraceae bacterium]